MQTLLVPIIRKQFSNKIGKTIIECSHNNGTITVFVNGNMEQSNALLANIVINEVGDTFKASKDSKTLDAQKKPIYKAGDTVVRTKQSYDFKSFAGETKGAEFAQGAKAFGLQLVVQM